MTAAWLAFDAVLVLGIVAVAWLALASRDAFRMIVLFIVFGLLVALAWVRLRAPDVALAEAAVGAGVTGALFVATRNAMRADGQAPDTAPAPRALRLTVLALSAGVTGLLGAAFVLIARPVPGLLDPAMANLAASGVSNPVTAVLLNYRAYDTLLEVVVLLAAMVVVRQVTAAEVPRPAPALGPIMDGFARLVLPATVLVAGYVLWLGAFAPGGAFQAGALLGAAGIVLLLARAVPMVVADGGTARATFALGVAGFAGAGALTAASGQGMLAYPAGAAKAWILAIESGLTLAIAATLAGLFLATLPARAAGRSANA